LAREVGEDLEGLVTVEEDIIGARAVEQEESEKKEGNKKKSKDKGKAKAQQETDQEFLMKYGTSWAILFFLATNNLTFLVTFSTVAGSIAPQSASPHMGK
jgi:hypothetical protein